MAKSRGWWELKLTKNTMDDLNDCDKGHIAKLIIDGFTSGEVCEDEEDD